MSNRCPGCNKFATLTLNESPDVDLELNGTHVVANIRLVRESECCSEEMREVQLGPEQEIDIAHFKGHVADNGDPLVEPGKDDEDDIEHELEIEEGNVEVETRQEGRRTIAKVTVQYDIKCSCQKDGAESLFSDSLDDEIDLGHMEDCT